MFPGNGAAHFLELRHFLVTCLFASVLRNRRVVFENGNNALSRLYSRSNPGTGKTTDTNHFCDILAGHRPNGPPDLSTNPVNNPRDNPRTWLLSTCLITRSGFPGHETVTRKRNMPHRLRTRPAPTLTKTPRTTGKPSREPRHGSPPARRPHERAGFLSDAPRHLAGR